MAPRTFTVFALVLAPVVASSQSSGPSERGSGGSDRLERIVVTASRTPVDASRVGSSLTVVGGDTLEARQVVLVSDALRDVPGVAVSRGGGLGAVTQVRIRGSEGNHALVLIDGIEANNPVSNSEFDFANLLATDVERIEILRGPQSALFGSDAVGGVINVITRASDPGFTSSAQLEAGTLGTQRAALRFGGGNERFGGGGALSRFSTDGENISRFGDEKDGFDNSVLSLHGRADLSAKLSLAASLRALDSKQSFDVQDFAVPPTPTQGLVVDDGSAGHMVQRFAKLEMRFAGRADHRLRISDTDTRNEFFIDGAPTGGNEGDKTRVDYQLSFDLGRENADVDQRFTAAFERELIDYVNRGSSPAAPESQHRGDRQSSVVVEYRAHFEHADFSASARHDANRLFEDADTFRLTGQVALGERATLHTSYGTGVANPGFFELFGFYPETFVGNPNLQPEESRSFDLGVSRRFARNVDIDVTYFRAELRNEIQTVFDAASFASTAVNLPGTSPRRGLELSAAAPVTGGWQITASYTYTDAEQPDGRAELRRPRHIAALDNAFVFAGGRARLNVGFDYNGRQADTELVAATPRDRVELDGFGLVDVSGDYRLSPRLRIYGRVENLLDEEYEEWFSYRGRGRSIVAGVDVRLGR